MGKNKRQSKKSSEELSDLDKLDKSLASFPSTTRDMVDTLLVLQDRISHLERELCILKYSFLDTLSEDDLINFKNHHKYGLPDQKPGKKKKKKKKSDDEPISKDEIFRSTGPPRTRPRKKSRGVQYEDPEIKPRKFSWFRNCFKSSKRKEPYQEKNKENPESKDTKLGAKHKEKDRELKKKSHEKNDEGDDDDDTSGKNSDVPKKRDKDDNLPKLAAKYKAKPISTKEKEKNNKLDKVPKKKNDNDDAEKDISDENTDQENFPAHEKKKNDGFCTRFLQRTLPGSKNNNGKKNEKS